MDKRGGETNTNIPSNELLAEAERHAQARGSEATARLENLGVPEGAHLADMEARHKHP